jgi:hypothetical protein
MKVTGRDRGGQEGTQGDRRGQKIHQKFVDEFLKNERDAGDP